jgi:hypothetical protein
VSETPPARDPQHPDDTPAPELPSPGAPSADTGAPAADTPVGESRGSVAREPEPSENFSDEADDKRDHKGRTGAERFTFEEVPEEQGREPDPGRRRKRRWFEGAIAAGAALVVVGLCAGALAVFSAVSGFRDEASEAREGRQLRERSCLELEQRLNRLVPPGAEALGKDKAAAVRDENAALRLYIAQLGEDRTVDDWRQLLDARTSFADALDAAPKDPAFFEVPKTTDGRTVADELAARSPASCAGPIRRLQEPDL